MPSRSPNPQSGVAVVFLLVLTSAGGLALGLLPSTAASARDAGIRMSRHLALRPLAAELLRLADETEGVANAAMLDTADDKPTTPSSMRWEWILILASLDQRLTALEGQMLTLGAQLPDASGWQDLLGGLDALRLMRSQVAKAKSELMIFITPRVVSQVQVPDGGTLLIGGLKAK